RVCRSRSGGVQEYFMPLGLILYAEFDSVSRDAREGVFHDVAHAHQPGSDAHEIMAALLHTDGHRPCSVGGRWSQDLGLASVFLQKLNGAAYDGLAAIARSVHGLKGRGIRAEIKAQ